MSATSAAKHNNVRSVSVNVCPRCTAGIFSIRAGSDRSSTLATKCMATTSTCCRAKLPPSCSRCAARVFPSHSPAPRTTVRRLARTCLQMSDAYYALKDTTLDTTPTCFMEGWIMLLLRNHAKANKGKFGIMKNYQFPRMLHRGRLVGPGFNNTARAAFGRRHAFKGDCAGPRRMRVHCLMLPCALSLAHPLRRRIRSSSARTRCCTRRIQSTIGVTPWRSRRGRVRSSATKTSLFAEKG